MKHNINVILSLLILVLPHTGCKKLVEVDGPTTSVNSANIYKSDATAASVLTGIYTKLSSEGVQNPSLTAICYFTGLSSDELTLINAVGNSQMKAFYGNSLGAQVAGFEFWEKIYSYLYIINGSIEGISSSKTLTPAVKQQLLGEAKFMRAFCYFYLVNLYGNVPLALSTDYKTNTGLSRSPAKGVWDQIKTDLLDAQGLLSENYLDATLLKTTQEKVRPSKWAATALLARAYLYTKDWSNAEQQATVVLNNPNYSLVSLEDVFKMNNSEAIWQLQPVVYNSTAEGVAFKIEPDRSLSFTPSFLSNDLVSSFENGDQRKISWIGSATIEGVNYNFPNKYKIGLDPDAPISEYSTVLRLAEQYLIRAEARMQQGKVSEGIADLNIIRGRATDKTAPKTLQLKQLSNTLSNESALLFVEHERQTELFTEWGHRWLDLKRTNRIDQVMAIEAPNKVPMAVWKNFKQWYPISLSELKKAVKLTQNEGY